MERVSVRITGKVQDVMCRNTLVSAMKKRALQGGANNEIDGSVTVSIKGSGARKFVEELREWIGKELNDWHCVITSIHEIDWVPIAALQATTFSPTDWGEPLMKLQLRVDFLLFYSESRQNRMANLANRHLAAFCLQTFRSLKSVDNARKRMLSFEVEECNVPSLNDVVDVWTTSLRTNFEQVNVSVIPCPDLQELAGLSSPGICGDVVLADVGGVQNLFHAKQRDVKYTFEQVAASIGRQGACVFGAGAASHRVVGTNAELMPNCCCSARPACNRTRVSRVGDAGESIQENYASTEFGLLANLCFHEGARGQVVCVDVKRRSSENDDVVAILAAALRQFDGLVAVGGIIQVLAGNIRSHVMPDFPESGDLIGDDHVQQWLNFYTVEAPVTMLSVFVNRDPDPQRLDLRTEHTHFFSEHNDGGHYHNDLTPEEIHYRGYFTLAEKVYRVDRAMAPN